MTFIISGQWYLLLWIVGIYFYHTTADNWDYEEHDLAIEKQNSHTFQHPSATGLPSDSKRKDDGRTSRSNNDRKFGGYRCVSVDANVKSEDYDDQISESSLENTNDSLLKGKLIPGAKVKFCNHFCFTLWSADPKNASRTTVSTQGCWRMFDSCHANLCLSKEPPKPNNMHFCCCSGDFCNANYKDVYNPAEHTTTTTTTDTPVADVDHNYRQKTIIIALVSVISVSLVVVLTYLSYRMCITPKPTPTPPESTVSRTDQGGVTPSSVLDIDVEKTFTNVLVSGRYSEIRRGKLEDREVVIKIYSHQHRQYYYNERDAYSLPFMEHENLVKFYGAKEQTPVGSTPHRYLILLEYLPLGSLSSYLKNTSIDWNCLCTMSQGIATGLAHLHTDMQQGDLFKPSLAHRDLNTRNILVTSDHRCVITDLGFATAMMGSKLIRNGVAEHAEQASLADVGTLRYMAPEVFDGAVNLRDCEASLKQIDIYSLGLVIWELATRCVDLYQGAPLPEYQLPFQAEAGLHPTFDEMQDLVVKYKTRPKFPDVWKDSNPAVRSLKETIEDCWDSDSEARLTALCVQERIADMAILWTRGTRHRGVTPTLNATMNLPEGSQTSPSAFVSNGMAYLPLFVDRRPESDQNFEDEASQRRRMDLNSPFLTDASARGQLDSTSEKDGGLDASVTTPLIGHGKVFPASRVPSAKRVKSWRQEQSVSESTMETVVPTTPSSDDQDSYPFPSEQLESYVSSSRTVTGVKANNILMAHNRNVISHPNQGRNPTVERNTHKHSDEELTVSGNQLILSGDPTAPVNNSVCGGADGRRNSYGTPSARPGHVGSYDGSEIGGESTSLVQHDALNHQHQHRNTPIPYVQNQVHSDTNLVALNGTQTSRLKLANVNGHVDGTSVHPQTCNVSEDIHGMTSSSQRREVTGKSIKLKLSRLIRPKDFGLKFAQMLFGSKLSQNHLSNYSTAPTQDLESGSTIMSASPSWQRGPLPPNEISNHYVNRGLESSPTGRGNAVFSNRDHTNATMEVKLINGIPVTNVLPCSEMGISSQNTSQNSNVQNPEARLSSTNVMRMGMLAPSDHSSHHTPSLFSNVSQLAECPNDIKRQSEEERISLSCMLEPMGNSYADSVKTELACVELKDLNQNPAEAPQESLATEHLFHSENVKNLFNVSKSSVENFNDNLREAEKLPTKVNDFELCHNNKEKTVDMAVDSSLLISTPPTSAQSPRESLCHSETSTSMPNTLSNTHNSASNPTRSSRSAMQTFEETDTSNVSGENNQTDQNNLPLKESKNSPCGLQLDDFTGIEDDDTSGKDSSLSLQIRPQSLNVKGHSYSRSRKPARVGGPASVIAAVSSSDTNSSEAELDFYAKSEGNGPVTAVPNVSLNKRPSTLKKSLSASSSCHEKEQRYSQENSEKKFDEHRSRTPKNQHLRSSSVSKHDKPTSSGEKIRRRIKTPISFKNARLSLYDDRLMTQSLDNCDLKVIRFEEADDCLMTQSCHPSSTSRNERIQNVFDVCDRNAGSVGCPPHQLSQLANYDDKLVACPVDVDMPNGCLKQGAFPESFKLVRSTSNLVV